MYSFAARTVDTWNKLPEDVKTCQNSKIFKKPTEKTIEMKTHGELTP